jgi:hypothetical protein
MDLAFIRSGAFGQHRINGITALIVNVDTETAIGAGLLPSDSPLGAFSSNRSVVLVDVPFTSRT